MISTVSAQIQNASLVDWKTLLSTPLFQFFIIPIVKYALSPIVAVGFFYWLFTKTYNFGAFNEKINMALRDIDDLKKDGKKLLSHMDIIKAHLVTNTGLAAGLFAPGSPLKLLKAGIRLLNLSGFVKIYSNNKDWFINEAKKYNIKTLSDLDETSFKLMEICRDSKKFTDLKEIAFLNGVGVDTLLRVLSIYLRDELSKELKVS